MNEKPKKSLRSLSRQKSPELRLICDSQLPEAVVEDLTSRGYTTQRDLALELQSYGYAKRRSFIEVSRLCNQSTISPYDSTILDVVLGKSDAKKRRAGNVDFKKWPSLPLCKSQLPEELVAGLCANGILTQQDLAYAVEQFGYVTQSAITMANKMFNAIYPSNRAKAVLSVISGATPDGKIAIPPNSSKGRVTTCLSQSKLTQDVVEDLCVNGLSTRADLISALQDYGYAQTTSKVQVGLLCSAKSQPTPRVLEIVEILRGKTVDGQLHIKKVAKISGQSTPLSKSKLSPAMVKRLVENGFGTQRALVEVLTRNGYKKSTAISFSCRYCAGEKISKRASEILRSLQTLPHVSHNPDLIPTIR